MGLDIIHWIIFGVLQHVPVYAPYVMMLLIDVAHVSPTDGCEKHILSYIQDKLSSAQMDAGPIPYPSSRRTRSASAAKLEL